MLQCGQDYSGRKTIMELEQLTQLINAVSESKLTDFQYEENGVKLCLKKKSGAAQIQTGNAGIGYAAAAGTVQGAAAGTVQAVSETGIVQTAAGTVPAVPGVTAGAVQTVTGAAAGTVQAVSGAAVTATPTALSPDAKIVKSPLVGVFYAAPAEDAKPYVSVGDTVKKGQILACVEAMKLMNEIESEYDGVVAEILAENGQGVGYGEPLFVIR